MEGWKGSRAVTTSHLSSLILLSNDKLLLLHLLSYLRMAIFMVFSIVLLPLRAITL
jgi:hypothetical protein